MNVKNIIVSSLVILISLSLVFLIRDRLTGYQVMSTRVVITVPQANICNMTFVEGWNLVSFPCINNDITIDELILNHSFDYTTFRSYDAFDASDPWKSYNPDLPNWTVQDITSLSRREGYWVKVDSDQQVEFNGTLGTPTIISLASGWNMFGYPSTTIRASNNTFNQVVPNFHYVYLYNASDPTDKWKLYKLNSSFPGIVTLNYTVPNYGYWIYMTSSGSILIT